MLARLLTPEHFGLISMVTALSAFAEMFKDLGLGTATIQRKEVTHEQVSTLFWVNVSIGAGLMFLLAGVAPLISWFYQEPRLLWVAVAISSTFLFGGLSVQHQALLQREMKFGELALIQVLATGLSTLISIVLAWQGFEYWALVWKEVLRAVIQAGGTWVLSHWLPGRPKRGVGVRAMIQTGSHVTGFNILVFASRSLDQILLGKYWGAASVGLYKQASMLLSLPTSLFSYPVTYVMTPGLSALQSEPDRYRTYYNKVVSFLAFGYIPLIVYFFVYADSLIALILGAQWIEAAIAMKILAWGSVIGPILGTCGTVMVTSGRTRDYFRLGVMQAASLCLAIAIGIRWGLIGVSAAVVIHALAGLPFLVWFSFKDTPLTPKVFYKAIQYPVILSGIMGIILVGVQQVLRAQAPIVEVGASLVVAPLVYGTLWLLVPGGKEILREYASHAQIAASSVVTKLSGGT